MKVAMRPALEADLPRLLELLGQIDSSMYPQREDASDALRLSVFRQIAADPRQHLLVAEADGRIVGTAQLTVIPHLSRSCKPLAVVEGVVVDEAYRGKGVGAALMRAVEQIARQAGCYKLTLSTNLARSGAHRFYSRLGWQRTHYGFSVEV
ncbi:MAG: GNAT family N-acetyltransferase [Chloroflexota bacterium]|nr:GNAT family N-acetyltransferase [Chloroflexota bacterium]